MSAAPSGVSRRGFASMDPERRRELSRKGGNSVAAEKRSFSKDKKLASRAGIAGAAVQQAKRRAEEDCE